MGYAMVQAATIEGVQAQPVMVEVQVASGGLPQVKIVGLGDTAVLESKERVCSAIKALGFKIPATRITINLAPALMKKHGSGLDLAIAVGILAASGQIDNALIERMLFVGELSLDGTVRSVQEVIAAAVLAKSTERILVGKEVREASELTRCPYIAIDSLKNIAEEPFIEESQRPKQLSLTRQSAFEQQKYDIDFSDIVGHESAIRALQIAACGRHNILLLGPPGSGKTMLASRLVTIMPALSENEALETALVYGCSGAIKSSYQLGAIPLRSPHHSSSITGLIGGGNPIGPGEVSYAHNGVLFLDEMAQFAPSTLQSIRTPLEDGKVCIVRSQTHIEFLSRFLLVGASNPCPCGYFGSGDIECTCSPATLSNYQNRIGGPLLDRFDMVCWINKTKPQRFLSKSQPRISSQQLCEGICAALDFRKQMNLDYGSLLDKDLLASGDMLSDGAREILLQESIKDNLTTRAIVKILRVARTCADLDASYTIEQQHVFEALYYRCDWRSMRAHP